MTYRERREAKAERLQEWAAKRETRAAAVLEHNSTYTSDIAFNTQPGHIPLRARVIRQNDRALESLSKASEMRRRAAGIQTAADSAIYSDDPDAVEQLEAKIARLEAERKRITDYNKSCRKGSPDLSILDEHQRQRLESAARAGQVRENLAFPGYATSNLSGTISQARKRLDMLKSRP